MIIFLFVTIITLLILEFGLERCLVYLNIRNSSKPLPSELTGIYDSDKYEQQQRYFRTNASFGMITSTVSFMLVFGMFIFGGFGWLNDFIQSLTQHELLTALLFFGILFIVNDILFFPFDWYRTFVIENRFGFNKQTPRIFITDKIKSWLLGVVIGGGILTLVIFIYQLNPSQFWLLAFALVTLFGLVMNMFYSELIVPMFNKQTPLPIGELRDAIEKFASSVGFKLKDIYIIDGSKRSTKANAYFSGIGPKKRIVLYDTLLQQLNTEEIVAVLAHEIGHFKKKHVLKNYLFSLPLSLLMFYLLGLALQSDLIAQVLGGQKAMFHLNAVVFFTLYSPITTLFDIGGNVLSRRYEFEADRFTKQHGFGEQLIAALKKISAKSLSNLTPHPLYVFIHYSHPTLYQRILQIKA